MNTIWQARKRPRDASFSFRTFAWLLPREAYIRLVLEPGCPIGEELRLRRWLLSCRTSFVVARVVRILDTHPEWRFRP